MAIRIQSSKKMAGAGGVKIAVHSAAGQGKTMLAATCPKPVVILTEKTGADALSESNIREVFKGKKGITYDIPIIEAYTITDIEAAIEMCRKDKRFETIIFDSVSEMSKLKLKEELPLHKNMMQAYGAMANSVDDLLREMRDDKKNWLFLFHSDENVVYDDEGEASSTVFVPGFEGQKMQKEFPYMLGDVYCMVSTFDDDMKEKRMLRTRQGDTAYYAKNRRGRLEELEEPHIGRVLWKLTKK
jgi:hypothetical protein|tara:strand:+ start:8335 stop:9063 length:729 start_codon:yes stop_codon:yes gene_type:complete